MQNLIENLRKQILRIAEEESSLVRESYVTIDYRFADRPVFFMAPMSYVGMREGPRIAALRMLNVIASIDDRSTQSLIHGVPRWNSEDFKKRIGSYQNAVGIDFSCSLNSRFFFRNLCEICGIEYVNVSKRQSPIFDPYENSPKFYLMPSSIIAEMHLKGINGLMSNVVAGVDENPSHAMIHGVPILSIDECIRQFRGYPNAIAIDFSYTQHERGLARRLCEVAGFQRVDSLLAIAHCGQHAVYEPAHLYRDMTLLRLNDFLDFAQRLDDEFSVITLFSNILFRLTYNRDHMLDILSAPENEYFSRSSDNSTFTLGKHEHFVDCGAFQGQIVRKFLEGTNFQYESITAFEPDSINFKKLKTIESPITDNFRPVNYAVSNVNGTLRFKETGTVSSHASPDGEIAVSTIRLDDYIEKVTLLKMDIEGFEAKALQGGSRLISTQRPRIAACVYHYSLDLLDVVEEIDKLVEDYHFRLRQHHNGYYYDLVLYASPVPGDAPPQWAR